MLQKRWFWRHVIELKTVRHDKLHKLLWLAPHLSLLNLKRIWITNLYKTVSYIQPDTGERIADSYCSYRRNLTALVGGSHYENYIWDGTWCRPLSSTFCISCGWFELRYFQRWQPQMVFIIIFHRASAESENYAFLLRTICQENAYIFATVRRLFADATSAVDWLIS